MDAASKARQTDQLIARASGINRALQTLAAAQDLGKSDIGAALDLLRPAVADQMEHPEIARVAAAILVAWGRSEEARDVLMLSLAGGGPDPQVARSLAWRLFELGDTDAAYHWLATSVCRVTPTADVVIELALVEQRRGYPACASRLFTTADSLAVENAARLAWLADRFAELDRADLAGLAYERAYDAGYRERGFLVAWCWFLTRHASFDRLITLGTDPALGITGLSADLVRMFATQARLARDLDLTSVAAALAERERSPKWVSTDRLVDRLSVAITAGEPWSWIRLSDGEARFFIHAFPDVAPWLDPVGRRSTASVIWDNWFGQELDTVAPDNLDELGRQLDAAVLDADLLGVTPSNRLRFDKDHSGYLAYLEELLNSRWSTSRPVELCDALANYELNDRLPLLAPLLRDLPFLGVISPHPDLADRLQRHLRITAVAAYNIPGESRLERQREKLDRGTHFPHAYRRLLADLSVPHRGAVFIVAGGLLGKVYCHRIKTLGGIALDIGAIVDAWVGINSRGTILDQAMQATLPS